MPDQDQTKPATVPFDFSRFPADTLFYERREGQDRRDFPAPPPVVEAAPPRAPGERRAKKERRRRIDPTTFEKQYTDDELEFMNAMQRFKMQSGRSFPSHGEVLNVAHSLGYRKADATKPDANPDVRVNVALVQSNSGAGVNDRVIAGMTRLGAVADSAKVLDPQLSAYTTDAGNHVTITVSRLG